MYGPEPPRTSSSVSSARAMRSQTRPYEHAHPAAGRPFLFNRADGPRNGAIINGAGSTPNSAFRSIVDGHTIRLRQFLR
jgi:hypothetical protein